MTDVYVAGLWFLVRFGGDCDSYIIYIGNLVLSTGLITWICSDDGLALETSAFESLYDGQFTLSTQLIKPNYYADAKRFVFFFSSW